MELLCEFCSEFAATFRCLRCGFGLCAGCCLHADPSFQPSVWGDPTASQAYEYYKVCPNCHSRHVVGREPQPLDSEP